MNRYRMNNEDIFIIFFPFIISITTTTTITIP